MREELFHYGASILCNEVKLVRRSFLRHLQVLYIAVLYRLPFSVTVMSSSCNSYKYSLILAVEDIDDFLLFN